MKLSEFLKIWQYVILTYVIVKLFAQLDAITAAILKNSDILNNLYTMFLKSRFFK